MRYRIRTLMYEGPFIGEAVLQDEFDAPSDEAAILYYEYESRRGFFDRIILQRIDQPEIVTELAQAEME